MGGDFGTRWLVVGEGEVVCAWRGVRASVRSGVWGEGFGVRVRCECEIVC